MAISMLKIRRPLGRLIFNMGIAIPGKTVFLIETAPWRSCPSEMTLMTMDTLTLESIAYNNVTQMEQSTPEIYLGCVKLRGQRFGSRE